MAIQQTRVRGLRLLGESDLKYHSLPLLVPLGFGAGGAPAANMTAAAAMRASYSFLMHPSSSLGIATAASFSALHSKVRSGRSGHSTLA